MRRWTVRGQAARAVRELWLPPLPPETWGQRLTTRVAVATLRSLSEGTEVERVVWAAGHGRRVADAAILARATAALREIVTVRA
jgi:hypothetical protein